MKSSSHPKLIDRRVRDKWAAQGANDIYQRSMEEARKILEIHKPHPLSDDIKAALREIVRETKSHFGLDYTTPDF
jgi:trimethylamine--corrinoid protein Co-methyltransferase